MALVSYSDSEASDSEQEKATQKNTTPAPTVNSPKQPSSTSGANFLVDRGNPRKIRVALPEIKPESGADGDQEGEDGPARKKAKIGGGGGGAFSGFNSMLPAPKKAATADKVKKTTGPSRKVFSLKTGAGPGFDRGADAEMRHNQALGTEDGNEEIPKAGSLQTEDSPETGTTDKPKEEAKGEPKLKGNPMMFKPLSVGRNSQQKKKPPKTTTSSLPAADELRAAPQQPKQQEQTSPPAVQRPKPSLFSLSTEDTSATTPLTGPSQSTAYEPLVYNATPDAPPAGPELEPQSASIAPEPTQQGQPQTLDHIADDLNLSRAQRRHLFGRHGDSSKSKILNFNTDAEYVANQEMAQTELAATQHNPVRAIAPGKHTLQQLVNAASTQREALEESFATGRRNKQEAGSKYGW